MEKLKIKQVHLVAEMENGDIKQFGLTVKQRITLNEFAKQMGSEEELVLMNDSLDLMLKSRCKKQVKYNYVNKPYLIKTFKDKLDLGISVDLADCDDIILEDGVWAEVIKEEIPTQEEIDRVLDYLKNKNNS